MTFRERFSRLRDDEKENRVAGRSPSAKFLRIGTAGMQTDPDFDPGNARAVRVNRTHRVVRERAKTIAARRSKIRSLWLPLVIFSTLLVGICIAVWAMLDEYELAAAGTQVSSYQIMVPLFWSVPVSAALLAVVWFRQTRRETGRGPVE